MRVADVIGKVTLCRAHPSLRGATWLVAVPLTVPAIKHNPTGRGEPFVVFDPWGAGHGARIAVSEGAEAAAPFFPANKPVDAYNAAILDHLEIDVP